MLIKDAIALANKKYGYSGKKYNLGSFVPGGHHLRLKDVLPEYRLNPAAVRPSVQVNESASPPCEGSPVHGEPSLVGTDCGE